ncbi:MAG: prephenate dehydrogenase [Anaerolineales bacterium]
MTIQVTIIGLGQIGSSAGLALKKYKPELLRVGHDKLREAVSYAQQHDAVDKTALTLSGAVKDADIVLLALPLHEILPIVEHIAQDLKEGALILDTAPLKAPLIQRIEELLPKKVNYVSITPVVKAEYLDEIAHGYETAHEDLFSKSLMGVIVSQNADEKAVNMAANFIQLLGASPYFIDAAEMDGLMSTIHLMPQLLAAVMLDISQNAPGWREARKFAGKHYSQMTNSFGRDELSGELAAWMELNPENTVRLIDDLIRALEDLRDRTSSPEREELMDAFGKLQLTREIWLDERIDSPWIAAEKTPLPERRGMLSQLLGFRRYKPRGEDSE